MKFYLIDKNMASKEEKVPTAYNESFTNITVALVWMRQKKQQDGTAPAYWRVIYRQKIRYYKSGVKFTLPDWKDFCTKKLFRHTDIKTGLQTYFEKVLFKAVKELAGNGVFSFEALDNYLKRGDRDSVNDAFRAKINDLVMEMKVGNSEIYQTTLNALGRFKYYKSLRGNAKAEFLQKCRTYRNVTKGENRVSIKEQYILFDDLTPAFLKECDKFWRATGVSVSTLAMRMRTIRSIVNNDGKPYLSGEAYPFGKGKYLIPPSTRRQEFLSINDVWRLEAYETDNPSLELARDVFLFMFYGGGMNFKDLCLLKYSDITFDKELKFYREKTTETTQPVYVPLTAPMIEIINRQGNKAQNGYIFPFLVGVKENNEAEIKRLNRRHLEVINSNLKVIAAQLGLNTEISTNWARHSYMTHLLSELMLNETVVKQMVGHSTKNSVTAGYNHLTPKKRREINTKLLNPEKVYRSIGMVANN